MGHSKYLKGGICNHLSGDRLDVVCLEKVFTPTASASRVEVHTYLAKVCLSSGPVSEHPESDLEDSVDQWFGCCCIEPYASKYMAAEEAVPNVVLVPSCLFVVQERWPFFSH